jgi:hypothetical protein
MHNATKQLWNSNDNQFCHGCALYHYRDDCTDPYFNDPDNWTEN